MTGYLVRSWHVWAVLAVSSLFMACSGSDAQPVLSAGWSSIPNQYARHFQIQIRGSGRRLVVFGQGGPADTVGIYVLNGAPQGREARIDTPLTRVVVVSTTHLPFFTALGLGSFVVGVAHVDQVRDPNIAERVRQGSISEILRADGVDRERLTALAPQAVFDYPFGRGGQPPYNSTIAITEYLEEHPLGRAEWIRVIGLLTGEEVRADSLFKAVEHRYLFVRDLRAHLSEAPTVLFGSHWEQSWFAPPGNSYMATLIADAGGRYVFADSSAQGNISLSLEEMLVKASACEHLGVMLASTGRMTPLTMVGGDPRLAGLDAAKKGGFVGNSARNDLFGKALLEPEVLLQDLRCIFHPNACSGHKPVYFFPVGQ